MSPRGRRAAGLAALLLSTIAAAPGAAAGPAGARLHVERVIDGRSRTRGFWARLTGAEAEPALVRPYGIAWDGEDLVVADPGAGRVVRFDSKGRVRRSPAGALSGPIGVAACEIGLVVADSRTGRVTLLDRELEPIRILADRLDRPTGVACEGDRLFVVETGAHRVVELDARGGRVRSIGRRGTGGGELNFPAALALDATSIWVGDTLNFRVQRLDGDDGGFRSSFGRLGDAVGETPRVKGIAVDAAGRLWVTDAHLDAVALFTPEGRLLLEIGGPGAEPGEFSFPAGIAAHADGRVAIADSFNRRVQVLRLDLARPGGAP